MRNRTILLSLTFLALGGSAMAAIPGGTAPADTPTFRQAPAIDCDPPTCTMIHGKAPAPSIDDPVIRGTRPVGTKPSDPTEDYLQAQGPGPAKPPLYRASPMINDPVTPVRIHGAPPSSNDQLIRGKPPTSSGGN